MQFDLSEYLDDFIKEIKNLFINFEKDLELLKENKYNDETINEIFRLAHSIKGMSATMEFKYMEKLTHKEEDMLDKIRSKELHINKNIIELLYEAFDVANLLLESIEMTATEDNVDEELVKDLISKLNGIMGIKEAIKSVDIETEEKDGFSDFEEALKKKKVEHPVFFAKITIDEESPLISARAFMILTSLKQKEEIIRANPNLEDFGNKLFELEKNYIYILFSSSETVEELRRYLGNFPEVVDIKLKNIDLENVCFSFEEQEEVEINSFEEIGEIITYIETEIINKDFEDVKKILCSLRNVYNPAMKFLEGVGVREVLELYKLIEKLSCFCDKEDNEVEKVLINVFLKIIENIKKITADRSLLENKAFLEKLEDLKKDLEDEILENTIEEGSRLGEILTKKNYLTNDEVDNLLEKQKTEYQGKKLGEVAIAEKKIEPQNLIKALKIQKNKKDRKKESSEELIRIPSSKADKLVDLLEELMMIQSQIEQNAINVLEKDSGLIKDIYKSFRITKDIQNLSISFRMITLHSIFQKVSLNAHDAMRKLDKKVKLEISGEGTEIDRVVGAKIVDPLLHLIKNSISHGIEEEEERIARGKTPMGIVFLNAYSEKGYVYITITDDGKGIDKDIVYNKALEKGIIDPNKKYTEDEIVNFIFLPGFSTTQKINQISGRGVGMDVVKTEIQKLRGRIIVKNKLGQGLTIQLRIPQNMTSLNGTVIRIKGKKYIIPSVFIKEVFRAEEEKYVAIGGRKDFVKLRNQVIPLINTDNFFDGEGESEIIVVLDVDNKQKALPIDEVMERREVVVKPLSNDFDTIKYITGASILGDGKAALILGIESLFKMSENTSK